MCVDSNGRSILTDLTHRTMYKIKMDKTPKQATKDPKRQKGACKVREKYMNKLQECFSNKATGAITRSICLYFHGVGAVTVLVPVYFFLIFFLLNHISFQTSSKE